MKQVVPLLFLAACAQAKTIVGITEELRGKCECSVQEKIESRLVGNCIRDKNIFTNKDGTVQEEKYFCTVDADSPCPDKTANKDGYTSYQACEYFVPQPGISNKKTFDSGCGPKGVDFTWKEFNGNCYMLVEEKASWTDARQKCKNHLVIYYVFED